MIDLNYSVYNFANCKNSLVLFVPCIHLDGEDIIKMKDYVSLAGDQWPWPEIPLGAWKMVGNQRSKK